MNNSEFLSWIWQRLVNVHGERSNADYMLRLNGIILDMKGEEQDCEAPQIKDVEWENGDMCQHKNGIMYTFIGECDNPKQFDCVLMDSSGNTVLSFINELSKPETPEAKKEREELEAAYDLYCEWVKEAQCARYSFDQFEMTLVDKFAWIAIVRKTGYRVEK